MPCPPGLVPVANVDQATGVWAGRVVATRANPPCSLSRARLGSWSCFEQPRDDAGVQTIQTDDDDLLDDSNLPVESFDDGISRDNGLIQPTPLSLRLRDELGREARPAGARRRIIVARLNPGGGHPYCKTRVHRDGTRGQSQSQSGVIAVPHGPRRSLVNSCSADRFPHEGHGGGSGAGFPPAQWSSWTGDGPCGTLSKDGRAMIVRAGVFSGILLLWTVGALGMSTADCAHRTS